MERLAARAHNPLSAQPPTANIVTDTEALNWKHKEMKEGRVLWGKELSDSEVRSWSKEGRKRGKVYRKIKEEWRSWTTNGWSAAAREIQDGGSGGWRTVRMGRVKLTGKGWTDFIKWNLCNHSELPSEDCISGDESIGCIIKTEFIPAHLVFLCC